MLSIVHTVERGWKYNMTTITEALDILHGAGVKVLEIYFAELVDDDETEFSIDVMCDPINDVCESSWTWSVSSFKFIESILKDDDYFVGADWEILTNRVFSDEVVSGAIDEWLLSNGFDMTTRMIDIDDATGSGYIKQLREMDLEYEINNATPLVTVHD